MRQKNEKPKSPASTFSIFEQIIGLATVKLTVQTKTALFRADHTRALEMRNKTDKSEVAAGHFPIEFGWAIH